MERQEWTPAQKKVRRVVLRLRGQQPSLPARAKSLQLDGGGGATADSAPTRPLWPELQQIQAPILRPAPAPPPGPGWPGVEHRGGVSSWNHAAHGSAPRSSAHWSSPQLGVRLAI